MIHADKPTFIQFHSSDKTSDPRVWKCGCRSKACKDPYRVIVHHPCGKKEKHQLCKTVCEEFLTLAEAVAFAEQQEGITQKQ